MFFISGARVSFWPETICKVDPFVIFNLSHLKYLKSCVCQGNELLLPSL